MTALRERLAALRRDPRERIRLSREHYFVDVARLMQMATVLRLRSATAWRPRNGAGSRSSARGPSLRAAGRAVAGAARASTRGGRETLGAERGLAYAFAWRLFHRQKGKI